MSRPLRTAKPARSASPAAASAPPEPPLPPRADIARAALVLTAAWAALYSPQLFAARLFGLGDATYLRAFAEFSQARWQALHERTHWNPYIFMGLPATASLQDSRPQWLPGPLLGLFDAVHRLPGFPPLAIPLLVHLAGMLAAALLARALWRVRAAPMVWAGLAWGLAPGLLVPFAFGQDSLVMAGSLLPVLLLAVLRAVDAAGARARVAAALGLSLATACTLLAAHPQMALLAIPLAGAFAIERAAARRRLAALAEVAGAVIAGAAMAAALWWPARLYTLHTVRGGTEGIGLEDVTRWSAGVRDLLAMAWPWAAGFGGAGYWGGLVGNDFPSYAGIAVLAFAAWGLARRDGGRGAARLFAVAACGAALLALGTRLGPVYAWIYRAVPFASAFRVAIRALGVAQLALALLSARGFAHLLEGAPGLVRRRLLIPAALALAAGAAAFGLSSGPAAAAYADAMRAARPALEEAIVGATVRHAAWDLGLRLAFLAATLAAATLAARGGRWARGASVAALALLALDLGAVGVPFLVRANVPRAGIESPPVPAIASAAAGDPRFRVLDLDRRRWYTNDWIRWRVRSITGNHPAVPRGWAELMKAGMLGRHSMLRAFSVRWLGGANVPGDSARFERVAREAGGGSVYRLRQALPRARTVPDVYDEPDDRAAVAAVASPDLDPSAAVVTTDAGIAGHYPGSAGCRLRWTRDDPDHLAFESEADSAAFLVVADTWLPGWSARLDGRAWPIHRVDHVIRGIVLPPGSHALRLDYEPEGWAAAVIASRTAWALWLAATIAAIAVRPRRVSPAP